MNKNLNILGEESMYTDVKSIVLAAGRSKRFKTKKNKLLHTICGQPMVVYPAKIFESLKIPMIFVLGNQAEEVKSAILSSEIKNIDFVIQKEQLGTGNAVACTKNKWDSQNIIILNGDSPLLTTELVESVLEKHLKANADLTFLTTFMINPKGYGRVIKKNGNVRVVEEKNCTEEEREINKVNTGIYIASSGFLKENIDKLQQDSLTGEIYLTDLVGFASEQGNILLDIPVPYDLVRGVNTLEELWAAEQIKRSELIKKFMQNGVRFELAQSIHLDIDVEIGSGSFIATGTHLLKGTKIGENCFIGAFSIIENSQLGDDSKVNSHTVIKDSIIGKNADIGPFARLRDNVILQDNVIIGNFVELKNTKIGKNSKAKHLAYLGDSTIGNNVNIGAGTITCNHDGISKNPTIIEDDVYVGSNNTIVAPLKIEKGAYTAAGSTLTQDVPKDSLAIGRSRQVNKEGYAKRLRGIKKKETEVDDIKTEIKKESFNFVGAIKTKNERESSL
ncbi:MAG: bifunctional UDP-N-acetylglucosamine diphosphorylase/glucosamine-1-phosphate N-acetyltransferase GlmU [bacterium]